MESKEYLSLNNLKAGNYPAEVQDMKQILFFKGNLVWLFVT